MIRYINIIITCIVFLMQSDESSSIIAYDCVHPSSNITTMSILTAGECNTRRSDIKPEKRRIQMVQLSEVFPIHIYQCKVSVLRQISHCGMHSHMSLVHNGLTTFIDETSREECIGLHKEGYLNYRGIKLDKIVANSTFTTTVYIVGSVSVDATCEGGAFNYNGNQYHHVVVQDVLTVTLRDYDTDVNIDSNNVLLKGGGSCEYSKGHCLELEGGYSYWQYNHQTLCEEQNYDVLYEGIADFVSVHNSQKMVNTSMYSVTSDKIVFTLTIKNVAELCHYLGWSTEHPSLFILEITHENQKFNKKKLSSKNANLFTYVNNKFIYVERHIRNQVQEMYYNIMNQKCELERNLLKTQLGLAASSPSDFAFLLMDSPGYTAVQHGEVVHVVKCQPVEVAVRATTYCYNELPVTYLNQSLFMSPRNHLLQRLGTEITCNQLMPSMFLLMKSWYNVNNGVMRAHPPKQLNPENIDDWEYTDPGNLAESGIYTSQVIDELRKEIMYPSEQIAVTRVLSRGAMGEHFDKQNVDITRLIDNVNIEGMMSNYFSKVWGWFSWFGSFSSGLIGLFICCRCIKFIIDTTIHGFNLYELFGLSWQLVGMFWDAVTHCLIHRSMYKQNKTTVDTELKHVKIPSAPDDIEEEAHLYPPLTPRGEDGWVTYPDGHRIKL